MTGPGGGNLRGDCQNVSLSISRFLAAEEPRLVDPVGAKSKSSRSGQSFVFKGEIFNVDNGELLFPHLECCLGVDLPAEGLVLCGELVLFFMQQGKRPQPPRAWANLLLRLIAQEVRASDRRSDPYDQRSPVFWFHLVDDDGEDIMKGLVMPQLSL